MSGKNKDFDYQLDLTPFISLLSVCICFLLLTVAWFQIGALSIKQVMGASSESEQSEDNLTLWIYMRAQNKIETRIKKGDKAISQKIIASIEDSFDFQAFKKYLIQLKKEKNSLNEAFIFPEGKAVYEDIVKVMDGVRRVGIFNLGLSPI